MTKKQISLRISDLTNSQINRLTTELGMSQTELISVAVDRMYQTEVAMTETIQVQTNTDYPDWIKNHSTLRRLWRDSLQWRTDIDRARNNPAMQQQLRKQADEMNEAVSLVD